MRPSVLVIYREDHKFLLDGVIPKPGRIFGRLRPDHRLAALARAHVRGVQGAESAGAAGAQPRPGRAACWRSSPTATIRGLRSSRSSGQGRDPFQVDRHQLLGGPEAASSAARRAISPSLLRRMSKAIFRYEMHTLPSEIGDRIGTSTLFAAWNAAIYVNQIEDERLDAVVQTGHYLEATQAVLQKHGGLWFNDEAFVVTRRRD